MSTATFLESAYSYIQILVTVYKIKEHKINSIYEKEPICSSKLEIERSKQDLK